MSRGSLPPLEDDFSRALLGSAEADHPSHAAYAKAAAALGIGVGLGVGASLPASAAVAVGAASAAGVARWSSSLGAKLLALGFSGALVAGAGVLLLSRFQPATQESLARASHVAQAPTEPLHASPALTDHELPASRSVPPSAPPLSDESSAAAHSAERASHSNSARALPARRIAHPASALAARGSSARASTGSSLAEQVQSLDRARVSLGSGDPSSALREIAHYRATWRDGVFLTEASVLEIEALAARGERSLAARRAADFVAAHPDSPQAGRLRALIPAKKR